MCRHDTGVASPIADSFMEPLQDSVAGSERLLLPTALGETQHPAVALPLQAAELLSPSALAQMLMQVLAKSTEAATGSSVATGQQPQWTFPPPTASPASSWGLQLPMPDAALDDLSLYAAFDSPLSNVAGVLKSSPLHRQAAELDELETSSPPRRRKAGLRLQPSLRTPTRTFQHKEAPDEPRAISTPTITGLQDPDSYRTPTHSGKGSSDFMLLLKTPDAAKRSVTTPPSRPRVSSRKIDEEIDLAIQQGSLSLLTLSLRCSNDMSCCADASALHGVVRRRHTGALKFILTQTAGSALNVDECCCACGKRPLDIAVSNSVRGEDVGYGMAEMLLQHGAKPGGAEPGRGRRRCCDVEEEPLREAVKRGHAAMVELLLSHGADPNVVDAQGRAALHRISSACTFAEDSVRPMITSLLRQGANPCLLDASGRSPKQCVGDPYAWALLDEAERRCQRAMLTVAVGRPVAVAPSAQMTCWHTPELLGAIGEWL
eukprot:TRINITY_DN25460_c0_g1_i1.p1 TRINITY_DN25460_c0_g1~~TRINITY_DN25460_c0_g1_i1.p1  ORF type:complete len:489 (-),score=68.91 TRINITY_DN25460_c0_g1_i1:812-2278(-)